MKRYPIILIVAVIGCAGAAIVFGSAIVGALSIESVPHVAPPEPAAPDVEIASAARPLTNDALNLAVDSDPFRPDRQRWPDRYRLPGEELPEEPAAPPPPPPAPPFRLIGTATTATGGIAVIEIEGNARVVDVGESLLGYTLAAVEQNRVTMVGPARTVQLPLVAMAEDNGRAGRTARPHPDRGQNNRAQDAAREMIERVRQSGGNVTPQMLQMLQRLQQDGRQFEIEAAPGAGNRMMIRTRRDTTDAAAPGAPFNR
jgi:hypothetical protein